MFANTPYFPGYSQAQQQPNTRGMNAPQTQVPDHTQLSLPTPTSIPTNYNPQMQQEFQKPKRKQVKNACVNCQKACKKCDEQRPCPRCIKYGLMDTCVDSVRKERKKGIKRGPYKKRKQANGVNADGTTATTTNIQVPAIPNGLYHPPTGNPTTTADGRTTQATATTNLSYPNYSSTDQFSSFPGFQGQSLQYLQQYGAMNLILQQAGNNVAASIANAVNNTNNNNSNNNNNNNANGDKSNEGQNGADHKSTEDEDGNKLSILSQLCTAVLDHVPATTTTTNNTNNNNNNNNNNNDNNNNANATPSTDNNNNIATEPKDSNQEQSSTSTPSQSNNHSREPSKNEADESKPNGEMIAAASKESNDK